MTEEEFKLLSKLAIDNSSRPFTATEKEVLKFAVDKAENWQQLIIVLMMGMMR